MVVASKTLIDRLALRIDRLEAILNPPPPEKWVVVLQFDDETDEDLRRKHPGYDPRTSLHLGFDDHVRTDWPVAEVVNPSPANPVAELHGMGIGMGNSKISENVSDISRLCVQFEAEERSA
jgi:hypothetical protein